MSGVLQLVAYSLNLIIASVELFTKLAIILHEKSVSDTAAATLLFSAKKRRCGGCPQLFAKRAPATLQLKVCPGQGLVFFIVHHRFLLLSELHRFCV
jgi:hypothetical protein